MERVLGIETSCDETSAAVLSITAGRPSLESLVILSQDVHALFGGVVWFLHGESRWYVAGMCLLFATFILFPLTRE